MCTAPLIFFLPDPAPNNLAGGPDSDSEGVRTIVCKTKEHVHYQQIYITYDIYTRPGQEHKAE